MLNEKQIKVLLSQMTEDEMLKVIQMCNNENNKEENKDFYNKLSNNINVLIVVQIRFVKMVLYIINISNLDAMLARKTTP